MNKNSTQNFFNENSAGKPVSSFEAECEYSNIYALKNPKKPVGNLKKSLNDSSLVERLLLRESDDSEKEDYYQCQLCHKKCKEASIRGCIDYSDDEFGFLKREIDSYIIKSHEEDNDSFTNSNYKTENNNNSNEEAEKAERKTCKFFMLI